MARMELGIDLCDGFSLVQLSLVSDWLIQTGQGKGWLLIGSL